MILIGFEIVGVTQRKTDRIRGLSFFCFVTYWAVSERKEQRRFLEACHPERKRAARVYRGTAGELRGGRGKRA